MAAPKVHCRPNAMSQPVRTPVSTELPAEVKLNVLDYISLPSDLKSLCLVSKAWRSVATVRLYAHVKVNIDNRVDVIRLMRCMSAGGGLHLKNIRTLTLLENDAPSEPNSVHQSNAKRIAMPDKVDHNTFAHVIFALLPENTLHTFRDLTAHGLSPACLTELWCHQESLRHLQLTANNPKFGCPTLINEIYGIAASLQTLDIRFFRHRPLHGEALSGFLQQCRRLQKLSLTDVNAEIKSEYWWFSACGEEIRDCLSRLQSLQLRELALDAMFPRSASPWDFSSITTLTLWKCTGWQTFLEKLGAAPVRFLELKHLAVSTDMVLRNEDEPSDGFEVVDQDRLGDALVGVLKASRGLESLHLSAPLFCPGLGLLRKLSPFGSSLRSLSFHDSDLQEDCGNISNLPFRYICKAFPHLEQLGCKINTEYVTDNIKFSQVDELRHLSKLRILHFAQGIDPEIQMAGPGVADSREIQSVAATLFRAFDHIPAFGFVVIGTYNTDWIPDHDSAPLTDPQMQYCFVKGQQSVFGQVSTIALPISRAQLRDMDPDAATILDWDAGCRWEGRLPGRLHD